MHLICHTNSYVGLIEGSCDFMGGRSLLHVAIMISLVTISTVILEI